MAVESFIRFLDIDGKVHFGEADSTAELKPGTQVGILSGNPFSGFQSSNEKGTIQKVKLFPRIDRSSLIFQLLCPLESTPIIICIGLNYKKHAAEAGVSLRVISHIGEPRLIYIR